MQSQLRGCKSVTKSALAGAQKTTSSPGEASEVDWRTDPVLQDSSNTHHRYWEGKEQVTGNPPALPPTHSLPAPFPGPQRDPPEGGGEDTCRPPHAGEPTLARSPGQTHGDPLLWSHRRLSPQGPALPHTTDPEGSPSKGPEGKHRHRARSSGQGSVTHPTPSATSPSPRLRRFLPGGCLPSGATRLSGTPLSRGCPPNHHPHHHSALSRAEAGYLLPHRLPKGRQQRLGLRTVHGGRGRGGPGAELGGGRADEAAQAA